MELFFELEIVYIVIGLFILSVTAFVTTRDFVPKVAFKRGMLIVGAFLIFMITFHYNMTTTRMENVKKLFNDGETIICENKMRRTISRSVILSKKLGWKIDGNRFVNSDYERDFHTSRCIEYNGDKKK
ncbi:hypothetical protein MNB_SV-15-893 [hydrothermal vent metagenome]|uniref:Uncharacterized protein n=1 Tax=hydrothermal vent metagenome TaxID=652676 RepID=A0A1W1EKG6_9ZZZZ